MIDAKTLVAGSQTFALRESLTQHASPRILRALDDPGAVTDRSLVLAEPNGCGRAVFWLVLSGALALDHRDILL